MMKFEKAVSRIDQIISEIEKGEAPLEQSMKLYSEGISLLGECRKELDEAEFSVTVKDSVCSLSEQNRL
ncbi:MAG: exodeoxyribonuclease VII small subunit [Oscillospiraceae bacterium]|nr:exodeoxyribonuclease VII small subunit [Oscillospiraceae bacterium]